MIILTLVTLAAEEDCRWSLVLNQNAAEGLQNVCLSSPNVHAIHFLLANLYISSGDMLIYVGVFRDSACHNRDTVPSA